MTACCHYLDTITERLPCQRSGSFLHYVHQYGDRDKGHFGTRVTWMSKSPGAGRSQQL